MPPERGNDELHSQQQGPRFSHVHSPSTKALLFRVSLSRGVGESLFVFQIARD